MRCATTLALAADGQWVWARGNARSIGHRERQAVFYTAAAWQRRISSIVAELTSPPPEARHGRNGNCLQCRGRRLFRSSAATNVYTHGAGNKIPCIEGAAPPNFTVVPPLLSTWFGA